MARPGAAHFDDLQHLVDPARAGPAPEAVQLGEVPEVVVTGQAVVKPSITAQDQADVAADVPGRAGDVPAEHADGAGRRKQQGRDDLDGGGLARAVGTEQAEQAPFGHGELDVVQDPAVRPAAFTAPGVGMGHPLKGDGFGH
jgi:hypothetical protein